MLECRGTAGEWTVLSISISELERKIIVTERLQKIKVLAMDVDGTLTDGHIYISSQGECMKAFQAKDGYGIVMLRKAGLIPVIITGRQSQIVEFRAGELGIQHIYQNAGDKLDALQDVMEQLNVSCEEIAYIGDDLNDLPIMKKVGMVFAPADCHEDIKPYVDILLTKEGGKGAVRECTDLILQAQKAMSFEKKR